MSLLSLNFFVFFALSLLGYYVFPKKHRWIWLLVVSLAFYLMADLRYMVYLAFSIITTYTAGRLMGPRKEEAPLGDNKAEKNEKLRRRWILAAVLVLNIGRLLFLKFYNYSATTVALLAGRVGWELTPPLFELIMPLGISFYTLQVAGYCIDVYKRKITPERHILKYALFVSFFPQIIQGPIPRYDFLAPQLTAPHAFQYKNFSHGLQLMLWGYFKKMVVADRAALVVSAVFDHYAWPAHFDGAQVLFAAVLFAVQLYADFSGCVDIVRGCAQTFGIDLPRNFDRPYFATSIQDFWRRWHISLSSWLRDYVYIPLGGNRKGRVRQYVNIMVVFLVSGIWHGVGFRYLAWGFLHGFYQVAGKILKPLRDQIITRTGVNRETVGYRVLQMIPTFSLVTLAWIFFRATSLRTALSMVKRLLLDFHLSSLIGDSLYTFGLSERNTHLLFAAIVVMILVSILQKGGSIRERLDRQPLLIRWAVFLAGVTAVLVFGVYGPGINSEAFIYAQF